MDRNELAVWEEKCLAKVASIDAADAAHDLAHVKRVAKVAEEIARAEGGRLEIVLPAAWLHDLVTVPKDHPDRRRASRMSAEAATAFLVECGYPLQLLASIAHAIEAHSFSAAIEPQTLEARIVQDADRLDALGAIGIARCFATSGALGREFYDCNDPMAMNRPLDDSKYALDHFETKLFRIAETLKTESGRAMGRRRVEFMRAFVRELESEIGEDSCRLPVAGC